MARLSINHILDKPRKVGSLGQLLRASILSSVGGGGGGFSPLPDGFLLPDGVPDPVAIFRPEAVELNESGQVTKILNLGTGGSALDATPTTSNLITVPVNPEWNDKQVFRMSETSTGGYVMGTHILNTHTVMGMATYKDGADTSFDTYQAIWSGGVGPSGSNENELVGHQARPSFYPNFLDDLFVNGALVEKTHSVLPMRKMALAHRISLAGRRLGHLFQDNFGSSRYWSGDVGMILGWDVELTDTHIINLQGSYRTLYGPVPGPA